MIAPTGSNIILMAIDHLRSPASYRISILEHARTTGCNDSQAGTVLRPQSHR